MKCLTKIDWILEDAGFMLFSEEVSSKIAQTRTKKESLNLKFDVYDEWKIINSQIKKKITNPKKVEGICACNDNFLCEHRKKYIKEMMNNG